MHILCVFPADVLVCPPAATASSPLFHAGRSSAELLLHYRMLLLHSAQLVGRNAPPATHASASSSTAAPDHASGAAPA